MKEGSGVVYYIDFGDLLDWLELFGELILVWNDGVK